MDFYRNFVIDYSLIGIVNPKFTKRKDDMTSIKVAIISPFRGILFLKSSFSGVVSNIIIFKKS